MKVVGNKEKKNTFLKFFLKKKGTSGGEEPLTPWGIAGIFLRGL